MTNGITVYKKLDGCYICNAVFDGREQQFVADCVDMYKPKVD